MGPPPAQRQKLPARESVMELRPESQAREYLAAGKLRDQVALITGGDSGIGRAVAATFAKEGADVAIVFLASDDSSYLTGQVLHPNGGKIVNG